MFVVNLIKSLFINVIKIGEKLALELYGDSYTMLLKLLGKIFVILCFLITCKLFLSFLKQLCESILYFSKIVYKLILYLCRVLDLIYQFIKRLDAKSTEGTRKSLEISRRLKNNRKSSHSSLNQTQRNEMIDNKLIKKYFEERKKKIQNSRSK